MANFDLTQTGAEVQSYIDSIPVIDVSGTLSGSTIVLATNPYSAINANYSAYCGSIVRLTVGSDVYLIPITEYDGSNYTGSVKTGDQYVNITVGSSSASGAISTPSFSTGEALSSTGIDATPTQGSDNLVKSDGVWSEINDINDRFYKKDANIAVNTTAADWALQGNGLCVSDSSSQMKKYVVTAGELVYIKASKDNAGVFQWQSAASVPSSGTNAGLVGTPVNVETDGFFQVPTGATYLIVSSLKTNSSNEVKTVVEISLTELSEKVEDEGVTKEIDGYKVNRLSADLYNTGQNTDLSIIAAAHFPTISTHTYRFFIKSSALLKASGTDTVNIGIGDVSPTAISTTAQDVYDGYFVDKTFGDSTGRRLYIRGSNYIAGIMIHVEVYDLTSPTDLPLEVVTLPLPDEIKNNVQTLELSIDKVVKRNIYIGELCQYATYSQGLLNTTNLSAFNVSMKDALILPKRGITIYLKSPQYVKLQIASGSWMPQYSTSSNYIENGGSFTFPNENISYRLSFIRGWAGETNTIPISVSQVEAWLASGELEVYYYDEPTNIIDRNDFAPIMAIVGDKDTSVFPKTGQTNTGLPTLTFIHASDFHSDIKRLRNVLSLADYLHADGALLTGDFVGMQISNGMTFVPNIINAYKTPSVVCVGNHDTNGATANSEVFTSLISGLVTQQGYEDSSGVSATDTWFYRDFTDQKIRVISLNVYEANHTSFDATFISQAQTDWLIATLGSVPSGYGVIMAYHVSETLPTAISGHEAWWNNISTPAGHTNAPITKIIDAFISKTTLSTSFVSHGKSGVGDMTVTISADFSSVASNEFICHCVGHTHADCVGTVPNVTNKQIVVCITCAIPYAGNSTYKYLANGSPIPRGTSGKTEDAINILGIDRVGKKLGIARVGSDVTYTSLTKLEPFIVSYI